jgi:hypothetical protein
MKTKRVMKEIKKKTDGKIKFREQSIKRKKKRGGGGECN